MAKSIILINGEAVLTNGMSDFKYSKFGCVLSFKYSDVQYRHCLDKKRGVSSGYYNYEDFLTYVSTYDNVKPANLIPFPFESFKAKTGDIIRTYERTISQDFLNVCWYTYEFEHVVNKNYGSYRKIIHPEGTKLIPDAHACDHDWYWASQFYNIFIEKAIENNDPSFASTLADIQQMIEYIEENIFSVLWVDSNYKAYITEQRKLWGDGVTYNYEYKYTYELYSSRLTSFALYFQSYRKKIGDDIVLVFLYLSAVMDAKALRNLPLEIKMKMLQKLALGDLDNWQLFFYNPEDDESVVVKIVKSITKEQADEFLDGMLKIRLFNEFVYDALYNLFYSGISNKTMGLGKSNLSLFVLGIYEAWKISTYNPYKDGIFNQSNFQKFTYNHLIATNPDPSNSWWSNFLNQPSNEFNFNAAPVVLNYISTNFAGIYFDNFKFYFTSDNTYWGTEMREFSTEFSGKYINAKEAPSGKILAVQDDYTSDGEPGLYGTYDYYQPVMLVDSNQETTLKIPVIDGNGEAIIDGESQKINSLVPIFVLKYIDDIGDESDFYTSIGYAIDIALIAAVGYGGIAKFKHLRNLSGFTPAIIAGSESGSQAIYVLYLSAGAEAISFSASTASFLIKLTGNQFKDRPWYKALVTTITWIELASGGGSVLADKMLKSSSKKLVGDFNANGWPDEFLSDARGANATETLTKASGLAADFLQNSDRNVRKILPKLMAKETPNTFSLDGADGLVLHTDAAISEMIEIAYRGKVPELEIAELIHISYKIEKRIETPQLILQMKYYTYVTVIKEYPSGFTSFQKYKNFCSDIRDFWKDKFLEMSKDGVNLNVKYELMIQGSVVRKRLPSDPLPVNVSPSDFDGLNPPGDIEFVILMERADFDLFFDEMIIYAKKNIKDTTKRNNLVGNIKYAQRKGNFSYKHFKDIDANIVEDMRSKARLNLTGLDEVNFSITLKGARLDLGPYIKFRYN